MNINRLICLLLLAVFLIITACKPDIDEPVIKPPDTEDSDTTDPSIDDSPLVNITSVQFHADKDAKLIQINTSTDWSIAASDSWIQCTATSGKGKTAILIGVSENLGVKRNGSLTVTSGTKQHTVAITQNAASKIEFTIDDVQFTMILVEAGSFTRSEYGSYYSHEVELDGFYIAETEVTNALWKAVTGALPYDTMSNDIKNNPIFTELNLPVSHISYTDITEIFLQKLNQKLNQHFRMTTEAEWEWAAMGGKYSKGYKYAGGDDIDEVAWTYSNAYGKKHQVKTLKANELGLYDMSGNLSEWCSDWYDSYPSQDVKNPTGPADGTLRVMRGGNYYSSGLFFDNTECLVNYRYYLVPSCYEVSFPETEYERVYYRCETVGFRIALPTNH